MLCETVHQLIDQPAHRTFGYLADVANLPRWAQPFCQKLERLEGGGYRVTTPEEVLAFEMPSDAATGAVSLRFGRQRDRLVTYPMRVIDVGPGRCVVTFTAWLLPGMEPDDFPGVVEGLRHELALLRDALEVEL